jgi:uncharacterized protein YjeT (DUF2065 family)
VSDHSSEPSNEIDALNREKARLRTAGLIILAVGLVSAGLLYWLRTENSDLNQLRESQAHAESRQMQLLYGRSGGLTADLANLLKQPGAQALLIIGISVVIAGGCFYLGQPIRESDDSTSNEVTK